MTPLNFNDYKVRSAWTREINAGCEAKIFKRPRESNPYAEGSEKWQAWNHGWDKA